MIRYASLVLLAIALPLAALDFETVIERYGDGLESPGEDDSERLRRLESLFKEPLDLNSASIGSLIDVPYITAWKARDIIALRAAKRINATYELVDEGILTEDEYSIAKYFITMEAPPPTPLLFRLTAATTADVSLRATNGSAALWRFHNLSALTSGYAYPNPFGIIHRATFTMPGLLDAAVIIEHYPYERDYADLIKGAVLITPPWPLHTIAAGALSIAFGQGLVFATGRDASKSIYDAVSYGKKTRISIDRGSGENALYGIALSASFLPFSVSAFTASRWYDAHVFTGAYAATNDYVERMEDTPPAHSTPDTISDKNAQNEITGGLSIEYIFGANRIGVTGIATAFKYPIKPLPDPDNIFDLCGQFYGAGGINWNIVLGPLTAYGEVAVPVIADTTPASYQPGSQVAYTADIGAVGGFVITPARSIAYQFALRYYGNRMPLLHNHAFADGDARGEYGVYNALTWNAASFLSCDMYLDVFRHTYLRYGESSAGGGSDVSCAVTVKPFTAWRSTVRGHIAYEAHPASNEALFTSAGSIESGIDVKFLTARLKASVTTDHFSSFAGMSGYALLDGGWHPAEWFSLIAQVIYYDARAKPLTLPERDIPGETSSSTISGMGVLGLGMVRITLFDSVRFVIKYRMRWNIESGMPITDEVIKTQIVYTLK